VGFLLELTWGWGSTYGMYILSVCGTMLCVYWAERTGGYGPYTGQGPIATIGKFSR